MKSHRLRPSLARITRIHLLLFFLTAFPAFGSHLPPDLKSVGEVVVEALQTRGPAPLQNAMLLREDDYAAFLKDLKVPPDHARLTGESLKKKRERAARSLQQSVLFALRQAERLAIPLRELHFDVVEAALFQPSKLVLGISVDEPQLDHAKAIDLVLMAKAKPGAAVPGAFEGRYVISIGECTKYPGGWRTASGLRWKSAPPSILDESARQEFHLADRIFADGELALGDHPSFQAFGDIVMEWLKSGDHAIFAAKTMPTVDVWFAEFSKMKDQIGRELPPRAEVESMLSKMTRRVADSAEKAYRWAADLGLNLPDAKMELKNLKLRQVRSMGVFGELSNLSGQDLEIELRIETEARSSTGRSLAGDYTISSEGLMRMDGRWLLQSPEGIRWSKFPADILGEEQQKQFAAEDYIATRGALPPGQPAPEIAFHRLQDNRKAALSEFRGKIVVLEFWATWCGPCQEPMRKLQSYRAAYPHWKEKVELISLSIDDEAKLAADHLQKNGWDQSLNVWAGPGGWESPPARAFRVTGIPVAYVIDSSGQIAYSGRPHWDLVPQAVERLVKTGEP